MQDIQFIFNDKNQFTGFLDHQNNPWFLAKDVIDILEISNLSKAVDKLDDDEKMLQKLSLTGQNRDTWLVNESGMYNLIFRSDKPAAKSFRKWVTSVVLPTIRKEGSFGEEHVMEKEKVVQELLEKILTKKELIERIGNNLKKEKSGLTKLNNTLHEVLRTAPNQIKIPFKD